MSEIKRRWPAAAMAAGFVGLAALAGCGGDRSVASKSAAAFEEAQKQGETFEGAGHEHGHGAMTPGGQGGREGGHAEADAHTGHEGHEGHGGHEAAAPGHGHGEAGASPGHSAMEHGSRAHAGHSGMDHGQSHPGHAEPGRVPAQDEHAGHAGHGEHGAMAPQAPPAGGGQAASGGHAGHGEHAPAATVPPGKPAATLRPDALDAPAATSVLDAQRSAEIAEEMTGAGSGGHAGHGGHEGHGGHQGHGVGTYRHVDAGRGPEAFQGSQEQTPGAGPAGHDHHDHGAIGGQEEAAGYVCPMHPEVTSAAPGKCPKCGMDLVKRRKG